MVNQPTLEEAVVRRIAGSSYDGCVSEKSAKKRDKRVNDRYDEPQ